MTESSKFWAGISTGDAGPYTDDMFSDVFALLFQSDRTLQGPIYGVLSQLAVSNPSGQTIRVASGAALVDGKIYTNTSNVDFTGAVPASGTNYYTIVLRKNFAAQTVRVDILGPSTTSAPAVTQTDGTTWEISIATVTITSAAVVTVTDTRKFCHHSEQVDTAHIESEAVDYSKVGNRVPYLAARRGNSSSDWSAPGSTAYTPTKTRMYAGVVNVVTGGNWNGNVSVSFGSAFSNVPIVLTGLLLNASTFDVVTLVMAVTSSGATIGWTKTGGAGSPGLNFDITWIAIGPG